MRTGYVAIAIDATHIPWHQAGAPNDETNGSALCVLHIKNIDLGAFTVEDGVMRIPDQARGASGFHENLMIYHGKPVREPQSPDWRRAASRLSWHKHEVFD